MYGVISYEALLYCTIAPNNYQSNVTMTSGGSLQSQTVERPEHIHYKTIERFVREGMEKKSDCFFDKDAFEKTIRRLELEYEFPYEVR